MQTIPWQTGDVVAADGDRPFSGRVTAAKKLFPAARAAGWHPYLIPLAGSYFMVGLAADRAQAAERKAAAEERDRARRADVRELVRGWEAADRTAAG